jgi:hypothetical protein
MNDNEAPDHPIRSHIQVLRAVQCNQQGRLRTKVNAIVEGSFKRTGTPFSRSVQLYSDCRVGLAPTGKRRLCTAHVINGPVLRQNERDPL